jgi:hypothetical protein
VGFQGSDRPAGDVVDAGALCAGSWLPRSVRVTVTPFWKPPLALAQDGFSGQCGLPPWTLAFQCPNPVPPLHVN